MGDTGSILLGQDRPYANFFVESIQNPFEAKVKAIIDPIGKKREEGSLTYEEAKAAQEALEGEIAAFEFSAQQYEGLGSAQANVVRQARKTLYGGTTGKQAFENSVIAKWREPFKNDLSMLTPPTPPEREPAPSEDAPGFDTILANKRAKESAEQQRKRLTSGGGRQSTILTGGSGLDNVPSQNRQYKTILGY